VKSTEFRSKENNYVIKRHNEKTTEGGFEVGLGGISRALGIWSTSSGNWPRQASSCPEPESSTGQQGAERHLRGHRQRWAWETTGRWSSRSATFARTGIRPRRGAGSARAGGGCLRGRDSRFGGGRDAGHRKEDVHIAVEDDLLTFTAERATRSIARRYCFRRAAPRRRSRWSAKTG